MGNPAQVEPPGATPALLAKELRSEHSGEYLRLARLWQHKQGLSWIFAAVDSSDLRDDLIDRLDTTHTDARVCLPAAMEPVHLVALLTQDAAHATRAHLILSAGWQPDASWWQRLNTYRERLADAFPKPLIWWLPDDCITLAARNAPDFWNWRETVVNFAIPPHAVPALLPSAQVDFVGGAEKEALQQRLKDIEDYLAAHDRSSAAAAYLLLEAAIAYERLGLWDASLTCAEQASRSFSDVGNARMAARAKGQIADILESRGKLDEALVLWRDHVLPVFEMAGYEREAEIARHRIRVLEKARRQSQQVG